MVMRAIGELCRDVVARSFVNAMERGSFEPREFAEVLDCGAAVGGVSLLLGVECSEVNALAAVPDAGDEPAVWVNGHAPQSASSAVAVDVVLGFRRQAQVDDTVVGFHPVDVVYESIWPLAVVQKPRNAGSAICPAPEPYLHVTFVHGAGRATCQHVPGRPQ